MRRLSVRAAITNGRVYLGSYSCRIAILRQGADRKV